MRRLERQPIDNVHYARRYGPWAVIAGASEGTGACFAEQLAAMGVNLLLVSRRSEALEALGHRLSADHGVQYRVLAVDLMSQGAAEAVLAATVDIDVGLYVSNAGTDGAGNSFLTSPVQRALNLLTMNAQNLVIATHGFGNRFKARGRGGVVVMSSGAGLGGQPWLTMYSATKAFELNFAESLWAEWQDDGLDILGMAAPTMNTPGLRRAVAGTDFDVGQAYDPAEVVQLALAKLGSEPIVIVPDGPEQEKIPQLQADRRRRLVLLAEWAKSYTSRAR